MARAGSRAGQSPAEDQGDADLVRAWLDGDGAAAEILIRRHQKTVYYLMIRSTGDPVAADDLTQKTFLKALSTVDRLRGEGAFRSWLIRIALNLSRSRGRGLFRWRRASETALDKMVSEAPGADEALDRERRLARVREAIDRLPKRQRQIVQLRLHAEMPFKEIAEVMETSEASAKVTYHNAVRSLKERIGEES